jgi:hypothetical protein
MRKMTALLFMVLLLSACAPGKGPEGAPQAWIDRPLDGSVLPLASVEVMSHAADPGGIEQFELSVNGEGINNAGPAEGGSLVFINQTWDPAVPGVYILEVRVMNNNGIWSNFAQVTVTIAEDLSAPILVPTVSATSTLEPSPTVTAAPPKFVPNINANCRAGPGSMYGILGSLLVGAEYPIEGVNQGNSWWYLRLPDNTRCWGSMATGVPSGGYREVPVVLDSATPTLVPTDGPTQQSQTGCLVLQPNQQNVCTVPCPPQATPGDPCTIP